MTKGRARPGRLAALVLLLALLVAIGSARAELVARGNLFVKFSGGIEPDALPRQARAPIAVEVAGTVRTPAGEQPPALRRISISINRGGKLDTRGLPICRRSQIQPSSTAEAMEACGAALVGEGWYAADVAFPEQSAFPARGKVLAFNARVAGKRAILAHVYGRSPAPITRIIVFRISRVGGTYGTVLEASLPPSVNRWGYLTHLSLSLHRTFTYRSKRRSYLTAACEAPAGFSKAIFPFAHASMTFSDGRTLASTLTRSCRVR